MDEEGAQRRRRRVPLLHTRALRRESDEEELAAQLRANYARNVRDAKAKRNDMQRYFDGMKSGDATQAKTMAGTLQGGKASVVKPTYDERFRPRD